MLVYIIFVVPLDQAFQHSQDVFKKIGYYVLNILWLNLLQNLYEYERCEPHDIVVNDFIINV